MGKSLNDVVILALVLCSSKVDDLELNFPDTTVSLSIVMSILLPFSL